MCSKQKTDAGCCLINAPKVASVSSVGLSAQLSTCQSLPFCLTRAVQCAEFSLMSAPWISSLSSIHLKTCPAQKGQSCSSSSRYQAFPRSGSCFPYIFAFCRHPARLGSWKQTWILPVSCGSPVLRRLYGPSTEASIKLPNVLHHRRYHAMGIPAGLLVDMLFDFLL